PGAGVIWTCLRHRVCAAAGQPPGTYVQCPTAMTPGACGCDVGDMCDLLQKNSTCVAPGICAQSKNECPEVGKPCPDGMPGEMWCAPPDPLGAVPELQASAKAANPIPTYVIGVLSAKGQAAATATLNQLAAAGGTQSAFIMDNAANVVAKLQEALEKIRSNAL